MPWFPPFPTCHILREKTLTWKDNVTNTFILDLIQFPIFFFHPRIIDRYKLNEKGEKGGRKEEGKKGIKKRIYKIKTEPSSPSPRKKSSRFGNAVTRDEYTLSAIYGENCGQRVARAMKVESGGGGGWLVAPKIARINIRARHCHSVNFPRCWLYPRQKEGRVRFCSWRRNTEGVRGGGRREKHRYPFPSLPSMEFYALRVFDAARTRGVRPHFRCILSSPPPLWFTLTRYFDDTRSANTDKCTCVWEWRTGGGGKKKK